MHLKWRLFVFAILFAQFSCKTTERKNASNRRTPDGIKISMTSKNGLSRSTLELQSRGDQGFLINICQMQSSESKPECSIDYTMDKKYDLLGLDPASYHVQVYTCQGENSKGSCDQLLGETSFEQGPYPDVQSQLYLTTARQTELNKKFAATAIFAMLGEHKTKLDQCLTVSNSTPPPLPDRN